MYERYYSAPCDGCGEIPEDCACEHRADGYRAGLERAIAIVAELEKRESNLLNNTGAEAGSVGTLHGYSRAVDALCAALTDDDQRDEESNT